ncbi:MAG: permease-like cell division protein FtsX, partial [Pseudomonadota bacterium]
LMRQMQVLITTLGEIQRTPLSSLNTVLVVAVALLLPAYLYIAVKSADSLINHWQGRPQISLFLNKGIEAGEAQLIFQEVQLRPSVARAELIDPEQALQEFSVLSTTSNKLADFAAELDFLGENPLPYTIVLMPKLSFIDADSMRSLEEQFAKIDGIASIRLDLDWVQRFAAILQGLNRAAWLLSALLALGLVLIIGNTIKLLIMNRRHEIEVVKLVGGTNRFVRRPFLYFGTLFGLLGAVIACLLIWLSSVLLGPAVDQLANSYGVSQLLYRPTNIEFLLFLGLGGVLGWASARWSVAQHIWKIRPK